MCKYLKSYLLILFSISLLSACGEGDVPQEKSTATAAKPSAVQLPAETPDLSVVEVVEEASVETEMVKTEITFLPNQVVYQEEIYKNWPYTEAPAENKVQEMVEEVSNKADEAKAVAEAKAAEVKAAAEAKIAEAKAAAEITATGDASTTATGITGDKPYQVVDGKISANAMEGWKTYNGGGCGACHGKGGKGGVGPNIGQSLTTKLSKADFVNIVTNGKSGTLMRPNKTNKRVMDNMDNLYAYLLARGDGVLGPGNLIKMPLGK